VLIAAGLAIVAAAWALPARAVPARAEETPPTVDRVIRDPRIGESSGLVAGLRHPGYLWTHNDSGNPARLYAIAPSGRTAATLSVSGMLDWDWEALTALRDPAGRPLLAIGDIGDNTGSRSSVEVALVAEPASLADAPVRPVRVLRLRYPGGPVDAEALLADPRTGRLYIVTKEFLSARLLAVPAATWPGGRAGVATLQPVANLPTSLVTDGAFLPDGRIVVRNYASLVVVPGPESVRSGRLPELAGARTPLQDQGESLAVVNGGRSLLLGSEGRDEPVYRVPLPDLPAGSDVTGAAPVTPSPTPSGGAGTAAPRATGGAGGPGAASDRSRRLARRRRRPRHRSAGRPRPAGGPPHAPVVSGYASRSITWSTHRVSASTSSGSIAGNIPTRNWLRPSLRYGSTSTIPLARRTAATAAASTVPSRSTVPTTWLRAAGSVTNGVVYGVRSAQPYSRPAESAVRPVAQDRPPRARSHSSCSTSRASVATAGVL
jgi:hypothetical protein